MSFWAAPLPFPSLFCRLDNFNYDVHTGTINGDHEKGLADFSIAFHENHIC